MKKLILASLSPRRKEILEKFGLKFYVKDSSFDECLDPKMIPRRMAEKLSYCKALALVERCPDSVIIGADTMVVLNRKILGKPKNSEDAKSMLKLLRGKSHIVITAFTVLDASTRKSVTKSVQTKVFMRKYSDYEIDQYVKTGEPMDKAGAYAIQGKGGMLVSRIEGDFYSVVGLPIGDLMVELRKFGVLE